MTGERFLNDRVALHCGDCRVVLATLPENSLDACICDPPYHLTSIVKRFGDEDPKKWEAIGNGHGGGVSPYHRTSRGFMGKVWDGGDIAFRPETWAAVYRVLKPGAHLIAMGGTRTYHRLACAIEDAGFEVRDMISWVYGSGFPKSHDVSKGIDRAAGVERELVRYENPRNPKATGSGLDGMAGATRPWIERAIENGYHEKQGPIPITDAARQWQGWGTALKPSFEPCILARKPLSEGTIAANVLKWGTGAINVDGCRIDATAADVAAAAVPNRSNLKMFVGSGVGRADTKFDMSKGRWPANIIHDGSDEVLAAFPETTSGDRSGEYANGTFSSGTVTKELIGDSGSAARFFYTSKADSDDRLGSKHPTVKPLDLMQYLVRLVCPKGGTILDPFAGTGTTGEAAWREGMQAVLIEAEAEYQADIRRRMALAMSGPDERSRESIRARGLPYDPGPLFGGSAEPYRGGTRQIYGTYADESEPRWTKTDAPRDDGPLFASRETWAAMWAKPFDFSQEPRE